MDVFLLTFSALFIGIAKAGFGGGIGILIGPLLALIYPAKESVGWMLPLLFVCDIASLIPYWKKWDNRNVLSMLPGALTGILFGYFALEKIDDDSLARFIGGMAIIFSVLQLFIHVRPDAENPWRPSWWIGFLVGLGTGFVSTLSHVGGVLTTMYLLVQNLDNVRFVGTTTALYFFINLAKIPFYMRLNLINRELFLRDLPYIPLVIAGTFLGVYLNRKVSGLWFGRIVRALVLITGLILLLRPA